jgi:hypothetical protein
MTNHDALGEPVAWRFWCNDPASTWADHWSPWSTDRGFRDLCEKQGFRVEFACPAAQALALADAEVVRTIKAFRERIPTNIYEDGLSGKRTATDKAFTEGWNSALESTRESVESMLDAAIRARGQGDSK